MKTETIQKANDLLKQIEDLKAIQNRAINNPVEWIMFNFGNGANAETVCHDKNHVTQVRSLIMSLNDEKLKRLQSDFDNLTD